MTKLRVAIIGCGPSGVVATKALLAESNFYSVRIFERRSQDQAGIGAWNYTPAKATARKKPSTVPSLDPARVDQADVVPSSAGDSSKRHRWPSPMYRDLYTNIPARLMEFNTASFRHDTELFPNREVVADYLSEYASSILQHVQFDTEVVSITKTASAEWQVQSRSVYEGADAISTETFDRVVVATGHYETPRIPHYPGLEEFDQLYPSVIRHSKYYRTPDEYAGKTVLTVGSGPSGIDIAHQISTVANRPLYQSTRSPITVAPSSEGIQHVAQIHQFNKDGSIEMKDGSILSQIDHVLFCTGYLYSFPFLQLGSREDETALITDGERLHHLYEQIFYMHDPTIAFLAQGMSKSDSSSMYLANVVRYRTLSHGGSPELFPRPCLAWPDFVVASRRHARARAGAREPKGRWPCRDGDAASRGWCVHRSTATAVSRCRQTCPDDGARRDAAGRLDEQ